MAFSEAPDIEPVAHDKVNGFTAAGNGIHHWRDRIDDALLNVPAIIFNALQDKQEESSESTTLSQIGFA